MKLSQYFKALTWLMASVLLPLLLTGCNPYYARVAFQLGQPLKAGIPIFESAQLTAQIKHVTVELTNSAGLTSSYTTPITRAGGSYITAHLTIPRDKYTITSFVVQGQNKEVYYAAPAAPSNLVTYPLGSKALFLDVTRDSNTANNFPLPTAPHWSSDAGHGVMIEVVDITGHAASDFSTKLNFKINNPAVAFAPRIEITALDPETNAITPVLLPNVKVTGNGQTFYSGNLYSNPDQLLLGRPGFDSKTTMELTISAVDYESKSITLTPAQLTSYISTPLKVQLSPLNFDSLPENKYIDYSAMYNDFGGRFNAPNQANNFAFTAINKLNRSIFSWGDSGSGGGGAHSDNGYMKIYSNWSAFAALKSDGSITAWGRSDWGGGDAPTDRGYVKIYSIDSAFAALKPDGSISAWGTLKTGAPTDKGYVKIHRTCCSFAALKSDGSITAWGRLPPHDYGGSGAPTDKGYIEISSNGNAFAALKSDGSIKAWGDPNSGGLNAPKDNGYIGIYSTTFAFAAIKLDGSITVWGNSSSGGSGAPTDRGYTKIYATENAFAALKADGSITSWGDPNCGADGAPTDKGYVKIYSKWDRFVALKADGSITAWSGGSDTPTDKGYTKVYSNLFALAALKADGSITAWGDVNCGGSGAPTDKGYVRIYSTECTFAALKADGSITAWGNISGAPTDKGYVKIYSTQSAFAAIKADGSITTWGSSAHGGTGAPTGPGWTFE